VIYTPSLLLSSTILYKVLGLTPYRRTRTQQSHRHSGFRFQKPNTAADLDEIAPAPMMCVLRFILRRPRPQHLNSTAWPHTWYTMPTETPLQDPLLPSRSLLEEEDRYFRKRSRSNQLIFSTELYIIPSKKIPHKARIEYYTFLYLHNSIVSPGTLVRHTPGIECPGYYRSPHISPYTIIQGCWRRHWMGCIRHCKSPK
jgi:hypothetical protein